MNEYFLHVYNIYITNFIILNNNKYILYIFFFVNAMIKKTKIKLKKILFSIFFQNILNILSIFFFIFVLNYQIELKGKK